VAGVDLRRRLFSRRSTPTSGGRGELRVGWFALGRHWLAFALVTLGALVGGVALIWLLVPPLAGLVLIVFFARDAFRSQAA
jgi:hypothetical protein